MNFRSQLEQEHSKENMLIIVDEIINHPEKMDEFMQIFSTASHRIVQCAAWPLSYIAQKQPRLLTNYYGLLMDLLNNPNHHPAVTRNILRALQFATIPKKYEGSILTRCFELLNDVEQTIAIKVFSMTVIFNFSKKYPDIIPELKSSIEALLPYASAGIKSRSRQILTSINQI